MKKKTNAQMGLEVKSFPKNKQWSIDQDYVNKLSETEKEWLGRFNQEYYRARFENEDVDLHKNTPSNSPKVDKWGNKKGGYYTQKGTCYVANNTSNRDLVAIKGQNIIGDNTIVSEQGDKESLINTIVDISATITLEGVFTNEN